MSFFFRYVKCPQCGLVVKRGINMEKEIVSQNLDCTPNYGLVQRCTDCNSILYIKPIE